MMNRLICLFVFLSFSSPLISFAISKKELLGTWDLESQYCASPVSTSSSIIDEPSAVPMPDRVRVTFTVPKIDLRLTFYGCTYRIQSPYAVTASGHLTYTSREWRSCDGEVIDLDPFPLLVKRSGQRLLVRILRPEGIARICSGDQQPVFVLRKI